MTKARLGEPTGIYTAPAFAAFCAEKGGSGDSTRRSSRRAGDEACFRLQRGGLPSELLSGKRL